MPFVTIRYGPYKCHGIIDYRVQKINGLFNALDSLDYEIEVTPISEYNRLSVHMYDREVFRCDIRNLMFNIPMEEDPVCQRAVAAIEDAKQRMCTDTNVSRFSSVDGGSRELKPDLAKSCIQDILPSRTELIYEIQHTNLSRSMSKHLGFPEVPESSSKTDQEKVGKVKIMENKNTTFESEPYKLPSDEDDQQL